MEYINVRFCIVKLHNIEIYQCSRLVKREQVNIKPILDDLQFVIEFKKFIYHFKCIF